MGVQEENDHVVYNCFIGSSIPRVNGSCGRLEIQGPRVWREKNKDDE
jgi:hypothetical protein